MSKKIFALLLAGVMMLSGRLRLQLLRFLRGRFQARSLRRGQHLRFR